MEALNKTYSYTTAQGYSLSSHAQKDGQNDDEIKLLPLLLKVLAIIFLNACEPQGRYIYHESW